MFDLDGASEAQVEEAARQALASTLDVVTWRNQFRVWCHVQSCGFEAWELGGTEFVDSELLQGFLSL